MSKVIKCPECGNECYLHTFAYIVTKDASKNMVLEDYNISTDIVCVCGKCFEINVSAVE